MKTKHPPKIAGALLLFAILSVQSSTVFAQGTAFTYQGRLNTGTNPATGTYDLTFSLYNAGTGGSQTGSLLTNSSVGVTNGLFTVSVDFGAVFTGTPYWLQIGVRTNATGAFTPLTPRQQLTPAPYAIFADTANNLNNGLTVQQNSDGAPNVIGGSPVNFVSSGVVGATVAGGGATNASGVAYTNSVTASFGDRQRV